MSSKKLLWLLPLALLSACAGADRNELSKATSSLPDAINAKTDSVPVSTTVAGTSFNSPQRKIIHTADFHCQVANVFTASTRLEHMVKAVGGVVQESHMDNNDCETKTSYYTADSLRQTKKYTTTAQLTLRVPSMYLDSVINAIPGLCSFIDTRTLKQNDVTYLYLSNELKNQVGTNSTAASRAMQLTKKSKEPLEVQEYENNKQEQHINRQIENLNLQDNVNYATITVALFQPQQILVQTIANPDYYTHPSFMHECQAALDNGWTIIKSILLLLINIWPLVLMAIAGWIAYRRIVRSKAMNKMALPGK